MKNSLFQAPSSRAASYVDSLSDKKDVLQLHGDLQSAVEFIGKSNKSGTAFERLSQLIGKLGNAHLGSKQPWNKDLLPIVSLLGHIPFGWLHEADFANISRFITKASIEKISLLFNGPEIMGIVVLLLSFLKHKGQGCRGDASCSSGVISQRSAVSHELLRSLAQIIMLSGDRLSEFREDILQVLLHYSRPQTDAESRLAAVDGLGNIFSVLAACSAASSNQDASAASSSDVPAESIALLRSAVEGFDAPPSLESLYAQAVKSIVDNLKLCCDQLIERKRDSSLSSSSSTAALSADFSLLYRLLVSSLRSASQLLTSACTSSDSATLSDLKVQVDGSYRTLLNLASPLFKSVVPSVGSIVNAMNTTTNSSSSSSIIAVTSNSAAGSVDIEGKVWKYALKYLQALAAYHPTNFIPSWNNFLPESVVSDDRLHKCCTKLIQSTLSMFQKHSTSTSSAAAAASTSSVVNNSSGGVSLALKELTEFRAEPVTFFNAHSSVLFLLASAASLAGVRAAAVGALRGMMDGIPLKKWLSSGNKTADTIKRVFCLVLVLLGRERHEEVVQELLALSKVLLAGVSLETVEQTRNNGGSAANTLSNSSSGSGVVQQRARSSPAKESKSSQSSSAFSSKWNVEDVAFTLFYFTLLVAAEFAPSSPSTNCSFCAVQWLIDFSKSSDKPMSSFFKALLMPFPPVSPAVAANVATTAQGHAAKVTAGPSKVSRSGASDNWRVKSTPASTVTTASSTAAPSSSSNSSSGSSSGSSSSSSSSSAGSSAMSPLGCPDYKKTFLHIAVDLCTSSTQNPLCNNNHSLALRNLLIALLSQYSELYLLELSWLKGVIHSYECSDNVALRLQACKMLSLLLSEQSIAGLSASAAELAFNQVNPGSISLKSIVRSLLIGCLDSDHQVKCQAMAAFGLLSHQCWRTLKNTSITSLQVPSSVLLSTGQSSTTTTTAAAAAAGSSIQFVLLTSILNNATDKIGTVRCAAFKSLGDLLINRGLCLRDQEITVDSPVSPTDAQLIDAIARAAQSGCSDSKLAVRIQASWVTGNLLIAIFQYRLQFLSTSVDPSVRALLSQYQWLSDDFWLRTYTSQVKLLSDSEKVVPTAVRSLGLLVGGLNPYATSGNVHDILIPFKSDLMMQKFLLREHQLRLDEDLTSTHNLEVLEIAVTEESQKMLFSVCQGLGYVAWSTLYYRPASTGETSSSGALANGIELELLHHLFQVVVVQLCMLKHGQLKLQLQAVQIVFLFVIHLGSIVHLHAGNVELVTNCEDLLIRILDALCANCSTFTPNRASTKSVAPSAAASASALAKTARTTKEIKAAAGSSSGITTIAEAPTEEEQEMQRYLESRSKLMQKLLVVLFWSVLSKLRESDMPVQQRALETISYYSREVSQYLTACDRDSCGSWVVNVADLSLGLPMVVHTSDSLSTLRDIDGKTIREIVALVSSLLLTIDTSVIAAEGSTLGSGSHSVIASIVPALSELVSGHSRKPALLSHMDLYMSGGGFYGVFDGLKPSQLLRNKDEMSVSSAGGAPGLDDDDEI